MSKNPTLNVKLLDKTLNHIKTLEARREAGTLAGERWDQGTWGERSECGTKMCFAGWAVALAGRKLVPDPTACTCDFCTSGGNGVVLRVELPDGTCERISEVARQDLGLTETESDSLFSGAVGGLAELEAKVGWVREGTLR